MLILISIGLYLSINTIILHQVYKEKKNIVTLEVDVPSGRG